jgi:subtilisin family serine protease
VKILSARATGGTILSLEEIDQTGFLQRSLGVAILPPMEEGQKRRLRAAAADIGIRFSRPERLVRVCPAAEAPPETPHALGRPLNRVGPAYWLGYRAGVSDAVSRLTGMLVGLVPVVQTAARRMQAAEGPTSFADSAQTTWGLQAISAANSRFSGRGVKVAVLDTGLDLMHPDLQDGRVAQTKDFVGQGVQDGHGHGTWCAGITCGPLSSSTGGMRYGVAYEAEIYVGKVLGNDVSGGQMNKRPQLGGDLALISEFSNG